MDDVDVFGPDQVFERTTVLPLDERVLAVHRQLDDTGAAFQQSSFQPAAFGDDDRPAAGAHDGLRDVDRGLFDAAGVELRHDLQDAGGKGFGRHEDLCSEQALCNQGQ